MSVKGEIGKNMPNKFVEDGKALISKVTVKGNLKKTSCAVNLIVGLSSLQQILANFSLLNSVQIFTLNIFYKV